MARRRTSRRSPSSRIVRNSTKVLKKIKLIWVVKTILYAAGIYAFFYCQREYAVTLISFQTVITIGIVSGIIGSLIIERDFKYYLFSIILLGSLFTGVLFKINRTFEHSQEIKIKPRILNKALQSAKIEKSVVTIEYDDFTKDIQIANQEYLLGPSQFISLTVYKGAFGYYIITYHELVE